MKLAWSNLAKAELIELRDHSFAHWGRDVTLRYLEDLRDAAKLVAREPHRARKLRGRSRIMRVRSHYLILDVDETSNRITVARILHTAMDIERHLPDA